jgi:hypothetical protein
MLTASLCGLGRRTLRGFDGGSALFFVADGLPDIVARYIADEALPPGELLKKVPASDEGLLTQAPPNTGAGWYSLATGHGRAWLDEYLHQQPGVRQPHGAFDAGSSVNHQQSAERGGLKVAQIEFAGGRARPRPVPPWTTARSCRPWRRDQLHQPADEAGSPQFGLQFDHRPGSRDSAVPGGGPSPAAAGPTSRPRTARRWRCACVIDFGSDKNGQNAYIYDGTNDGVVADRVLFSDKDGAMPADLAEGEWGTSRSP